MAAGSKLTAKDRLKVLEMAAKSKPKDVSGEFARLLMLVEGGSTKISAAIPDGAATINLAALDFDEDTGADIGSPLDLPPIPGG